MRNEVQLNDCFARTKMIVIAISAGMLKNRNSEAGGNGPGVSRAESAQWRLKKKQVGTQITHETIGKRYFMQVRCSPNILIRPKAVHHVVHGWSA